ncbi:protein lifeguard 1 [Channa argus]|uniref:protein lifeguard 1 n=1 Tax=Channa argus TaxID=215402 RepID=UPI0029454799|nr:hypothetical protein Q8A73_015472 [Channa argus]
MSGPSDHDHLITSKETQHTPGSDMSSPPPPYSYQEQPLPPYPAAQVTYFPPITETTVIVQPGTGCKSYASINQEAPLRTTSTTDPSSFDDLAVRRGFIRKVFSILTLQLLFTFGVVCVFTFSSVVKKAVQKHQWAYLSSFIVFLVVAIALSFCKSFSRRHPWNIIGLAVVTLSLSYVAGTIASFHNTSAVIVTMGATVAISLAIIAFSAQTRYNFTFCYGIALALAVDLIMFGFFSIFFYSVLTDIVYGCLGALLFSLYLIFDCQMTMGMLSYRLDPEEYIYAALMIYLDIVFIFIALLGRR